MNLDAKRPAEIELKDIQSLVDDEVQEGKRLEYKRDLPGTSPEEKAEFLRDVSAFANASGGYLIYGIDEKLDGDGKNTGIPKEILGLENINCDEQISRLTHILNDCLSPRISGFIIRELQIDDNSYVIFAYIPDSWLAPHMITFRTKSPYYVRTSRGKVPMDVPEIRRAFISSATLRNEIFAFRAGRIGAILSGETPVVLFPAPKLVLHVVPLSSFSENLSFDIRSYEKILRLDPFGRGAGDNRYNLDGYCTFTPSDDKGRSSAYTQFFRNGCIESVDSRFFGDSFEDLGNKFIRATGLEIRILNVILEYQAVFSKMMVAPPIYVMLSLLGIKDFKISHKDLDFGYHEARKVDRDNIIIRELELGEYYENEADLASQLKYIYDQVWNSSGLPRSLNFDKDGHWNPH